LQQLGDLVKRGLLVVEETQPVLIQSDYPGHFTLQKAVRLKLRHQEYIEHLEVQNEQLRNEIRRMKEGTPCTT